MRTFLITLALLSLSSCKLIMIKAVKKAKIFPTYASEKQINKFYDKYASTQTEFITLSDTNLVKKIQEPGWSFDKWELYDQEGFRVNQTHADSITCRGSSYTFLKDFSEMEKVQDTSQHLAQDTIIYNHIKQDYKNFDYTLIIYWSSWRGKFSGEILDFEKQFVLSNPELRIQVLKVNMDFREEMKGTWVNKWTITAEEFKK